MRWFWKPESIVRLALAALSLWALSGHRYGYYRLLRVAVTSGSLWTAYLAFSGRPRRDWWGWIFITCAVLFNPLFPVYFDRNTWKFLDVIAGGLFVSAVWVFRTNDINGARGLPGRLKHLDRSNGS
jgi:hypothetical protein